MKRILLYTALFVSSLTQLKAQFTLSGEYRPRAEYRHGFKTLPVTDQDAAFFIDQRTRINLDYIADKFDVKFVIQDVRVWGSQSQLISKYSQINPDGNFTSIHEAWGKVKFNEWFGLKLGRQEINLDDQRIFGSVQWVHQARSHDAAIFKINSDGLKVDFGLAYNQNSAGLAGTDYTVGSSYKSMQYLWAHKDFENFKASLLVMNLGQEGVDALTNNLLNKTLYQQTVGGRFGYNNDALAVNAAIYSQFGDMPNDVTTIGGLLFSIDAGYTLAEKHTLFAGFEHISGNDNVNPTVNKNEAFNPYFGTNHKFNGLMDYFYVGNHVNNVGLNDIQFGYKGKLTDKINAGLAVHLFSSDGELDDPSTAAIDAMAKSLGTEIDLTAGYKLSKEVGFAFGYSHMLGTDTMVALKGGDKNETANWAWLMVSIKPTFFTTKEKDKE